MVSRGANNKNKEKGCGAEARRYIETLLRVTSSLVVSRGDNKFKSGPTAANRKARCSPAPGPDGGLKKSHNALSYDVCLLPITRI